MSIKILIHLTKETGNLWNFMGCDNGYPDKCMLQDQEPEYDLAVIPIHM
jgi:hypothetical protein